MALIKSGGKDTPSVILVARYESSRRAAASQLVDEYKKGAAKPLSTSRVDTVEPDSGRISISTIRSLYQTTSYRRAGGQFQLVIVHEAQTMTIPAQNAFLKLLEEPPSGVRFILTCPHPQALIPTIRSRCQLVYLPPLPMAEFKASFNQLDDDAQNRLFYLSGGDTIEAARLLKDGQLEQTYAAVRQLITEPLGQGVISLQTLAPDRDQARQVADKLARLAHAGLRHSSKSDKNRWLKRLNSTLEAQEQLAQNANVKLVMDGLLLEFRA